MVLIHHRTTTWTVKDKVTDDVEVKDVEVKDVEVKDEVTDEFEEKRPGPTIGVRKLEVSASAEESRYLSVKKAGIILVRGRTWRPLGQEILVRYVCYKL